MGTGSIPNALQYTKMLPLLLNISEPCVINLDKSFDDFSTNLMASLSIPISVRIYSGSAQPSPVHCRKL